MKIRSLIDGIVANWPSKILALTAAVLLFVFNRTNNLREREADLDRSDLRNREIDALLRYSSTPALLILWLRSDSVRVRERLWRYEKELRHIQPTVDGEYLKSLGLKPSRLFSKLLYAVRDAKLDGEIYTEVEEKALIVQLLEEREEA